jgi:hypothetical protein
VTEDRFRQRPLAVVTTTAAVAGLLLGLVDLLAQKNLPYPWANLANSSAVWAIGAFAIGAWVRSGWRRPVIAGVVLLVVAVEAYYLAATLVQHDDPASLWSVTTVAWMLFGVLAGTIFGAAGAWSRTGNRQQRVVGVALPGAVLLAEAAVLAVSARNGEAQHRNDRLSTALIEAALAVVVILIAGRTTRQRLECLAACVPLAALGLTAFRLAGFGV